MSLGSSKKYLSDLEMKLSAKTYSRKISEAVVNGKVQTQNGFPPDDLHHLPATKLVTKTIRQPKKKDISDKMLFSNKCSNIGRDWNEMEFLQGDSIETMESANGCITGLSTGIPKDNVYARTRKILRQKVSVKDSRKNKKSVTFTATSLSSAADHSQSNTHKLKLEESNGRPSLMDMVRKFSSLASNNPSKVINEKSTLEKKSQNKSYFLSANTSSSKCSVSNELISQVFDNSSSGMIYKQNALSVKKFEPLENGTICPTSIQSLQNSENVSSTKKTKTSKTKVSNKKVPKVEKLSKGGIKISKVYSRGVEPDACKKKRISNTKSPTVSKKRNAVVPLEKTSKSVKLEYDNSPLSKSNSSNYFLDVETSMKSGEGSEISSLVESFQQSAVSVPTANEVLSGNILPNENSNLPVQTSLAVGNLTNASNLFSTSPIINNVASSYVTPDSSNSLFYINSLMPPYQPVVPPPAQIYVVPVPYPDPRPCEHREPCANCKPGVPVVCDNNTTSPPIYLLACSNTDVSSVLNNIVKKIQTPTLWDTSNLSNNDAATMVNAIRLTSSSENKLSSSKAKNKGLKNYTLENDEGEILGVMNSVADSSLIIHHHLSVKNKYTRLSLNECKSETNALLGSICSIPKHMLVKEFCNYARHPEFQALRSSVSKNCVVGQLEYKFCDNFQDCTLDVLLKGYVAFHIKNILKKLPQNPFHVKPSVVLVPENSKLNFAERYILNKVLVTDDEMSVQELISALIYVGLIVICIEYEKLHN